MFENDERLGEENSESKRSQLRMGEAARDGVEDGPEEQQPVGDYVTLNDEQLQQDYVFPRRVQLEFYFYDFPKYRSQVIGFNLGHGERHFREAILDCLKLSKPIEMLNDEFKKLNKGQRAAYSMPFTVDPSVFPHRGKHLEFVEYMFTKSLQVDIIDVESQMVFGVFRVPLRVLLRQGNRTYKIQGAYKIYEPELTRIKGEIVLEIENRGREAGSQTEEERPN